MAACGARGDTAPDGLADRASTGHPDGVIRLPGHLGEEDRSIPAQEAASGRSTLARGGRDILIGFTLLGALNFFRNANYYRQAGVTNPAAMNFFQMGAYLGVPAQVSIGVSDAIMRGDWEQRGDVTNSSNAIQPTFLQFDKVSKDDSWKGAEVYGYSATFEPSFFTNSVFADTYSSYGMWGWFYTILLYGFAGYLFAWIFRYSVVIAGTAGVVAYTLSEVWRIQIVSYGFVIFLLMLTAGSAWIATRWAARADTRRQRASEISSRQHALARMTALPSGFESRPAAERTGRHRRPD